MSLSAIVLRTLDFIAFIALPCESDGMIGGTIAGKWERDKLELFIL